MIVEEIRRQVELQSQAADGMDTRAMAVFAGAAAVAAILAPRVSLTSDGPRAAASVTLGLLLFALFCLLEAIRARVGGFSNGPDVDDLKEYIDASPADLEAALVDAFVAVKKANEEFLAGKAHWMTASLLSLMATVAGIAWLVAVGGVK
jgi:hypothetical protein